MSASGINTDTMSPGLNVASSVSCCCKTMYSAPIWGRGTSATAGCTAGWADGVVEEEAAAKGDDGEAEGEGEEGGFAALTGGMTEKSAWSTTK